MDLDRDAQRVRQPFFLSESSIIANGQCIVAKLPCTIEEFLVAQGLLPRSVVVEHNGEAVAPSEFSRRRLNAGDRLEIVKIVAGG
jgi:thiamine biosynthesis protein ThiS